MNDIKIRIFGYGSSTDHKNAFKSWSGGPTEYRNIKIVDDDSYTHVVLYYNGDIPASPDITHIPKQNVISFFHEPYEFLNVNWDYLKNCVGTCVVHDLSKTQRIDGINYIEGACYLPPGIPVGETEEYCKIPKIYPMSMVASNKGYLPGHKLRHEIIRRILSSSMDIHIWGRGSKAIYNDPRVKGSTELKHEMFAPYKATISIENAFYPYWVTEKFYDPILVNTIPLYLGAYHIRKMFDDQFSFVQLPSDIDGIMSWIKLIYERQEHYSPPRLRKRLLTDLNYQHFLWKHFNNQ